MPPAVRFPAQIQQFPLRRVVYHPLSAPFCPQFFTEMPNPVQTASLFCPARATPGIPTLSIACFSPYLMRLPPPHVFLTGVVEYIKTCDVYLTRHAWRDIARRPSQICTRSTTTLSPMDFVLWQNLLTSELQKHCSRSIPSEHGHAPPQLLGSFPFFRMKGNLPPRLLFFSNQTQTPRHPPLFY